MTEVLTLPTATGAGITMKRYEDVIYPNQDNIDPVFGIKYAKDFKYRSGDIIMCSYPKSGYHWFGNMIWKLRTTDSDKPLDTILELGSQEIFENMESPRIIFTHLKPSRLPVDHFRNGGKVLLVVRNPKDVMVSYYHHLKHAVLYNSKQTWNEFFDSFITGLIPFGSYFDYMQQWEEFLKDKPTDHHVEIFYYEDFKTNLNYNMARLNHFLGFKRDKKYIETVMEETTLSALRKQDAAGKRGTNDLVKDINGDSMIYRKGEVGDWKNYLTVTQSETVDKLMKERLKCGIINITYDI